MLAYIRYTPTVTEDSSTKCKSFTGYEGSYAFVDASTIDRCVAFWKRDGRTFVIDREWAIDDPEMDSTEY